MRVISWPRLLFFLFPPPISCLPPCPAVIQAMEAIIPSELFRKFPPAHHFPLQAKTQIKYDKVLILVSYRPPIAWMKRERKEKRKKSMGSTNWDETLAAPAVSRLCHPVPLVSPEGATSYVWFVCAIQWLHRFGLRNQ